MKRLLKTGFLDLFGDVVTIGGREALPLEHVGHTMTLEVAKSSVIAGDLPFVMWLLKRATGFVPSIQSLANVLGNGVSLPFIRPTFDFLDQNMRGNFVCFGKKQVRDEFHFISRPVVEKFNTLTTDKSLSHRKITFCHLAYGELRVHFVNHPRTS